MRHMHYRHTVHASVKCPRNYLVIQRMRRQCTRPYFIGPGDEASTVVSSMLRLQHSQPIGHFWFTQVQWRIARQLYSSTVSVGWIRLFHVSPHSPTCLYWYSSWQTMSIQLSLLSVQSSAWSCNSRMWALQYTGVYRAFYGIHGSRESGCNKRGVNDTYLLRYNESTKSVDASVVAQYIALNLHSMH